LLLLGERRIQQLVKIQVLRHAVDRDDGRELRGRRDNRSFKTAGWRPPIGLIENHPPGRFFPHPSVNVMDRFSNRFDSFFGS
jgi:hypothetical protein